MRVMASATPSPMSYAHTIQPLFDIAVCFHPTNVPPSFRYKPGRETPQCALRAHLFVLCVSINATDVAIFSSMLAGGEAMAMASKTRNTLGDGGYESMVCWCYIMTNISKRG